MHVVEKNFDTNDEEYEVKYGCCKRRQFVSKWNTSPFYERPSYQLMKWSNYGGIEGDTLENPPIPCRSDLNEI